MIFYSARSEGYEGEPVKGVDRRFEASGDFVSAIFRVMPHGNDPDRFKRIVKEIQSVKPITLSEYNGGKAKPVNDIQFPPFGKTDADVFGNNLLEVTQPKSVPAESWLPINRKDEILSVNLRIHTPDVEKMKTWRPPKVERIGN